MSAKMPETPGRCARNRSRHTLEAYTDSVKRLVDNAHEHEHGHRSRRAVEACLADGVSDIL